MVKPDPERTAPQQRGRPFRPGQSGNPAGRPKGARNKATLAAEALLDGEAEALTRKVIALALEGEPTALRLCMERLLPPRKDRVTSFCLPPLESAEDVPHAISAILTAVAEGQLTPSDATALMGMVEAYRRTATTTEPITSTVAPVIQLQFIAPNSGCPDAKIMTLASEVAPARPLLAPPGERELL